MNVSRVAPILRGVVRYSSFILAKHDLKRYFFCTGRLELE